MTNHGAKSKYTNFKTITINHNKDKNHKQDNKKILVEQQGCLEPPAYGRLVGLTALGTPEEGHGGHDRPGLHRRGGEAVGAATGKRSHPSSTTKISIPKDDTESINKNEHIDKYPTPHTEENANNNKHPTTYRKQTETHNKNRDTTQEHTEQEITEIVAILKDIGQVLEEETQEQRMTDSSQITQNDKNEDAQDAENNENAFIGAAGRTRDGSPSQRRRKGRETARKRNTKRGIRSTESIQRRIEDRTNRRRKRRQAYRRKEYKNPWLEHFHTLARERAKTKNPQLKIRLGKKFKMATLSTRSLKKPGMREEIEKWMKENEIMVLAIQDTRIKQNQKEARGAYTWYMSGENKQKEIEKYIAGVGIVIDNNFAKYVEDVIPHTDRRIQLKLKGTCKMNIFSIYLPPAETTQGEDKNWIQFKEDVYQQLEKITNKAKGQGPMYIMGDWNARMQKAQNKTERTVIGKWTLEPEKSKVQELSEDVTWNRDRCIEFCLKQKLVLANTRFKKTKEKTATFRTPGTLETEEIVHKKHEQIDYIAVQQRWKNTITDAESNTKANLDTDHYPVTATCRIKLRAEHNKKGPGRKKYGESTKEQTEQRNKQITETMSKIRQEKTSVEEMTKQVMNILETGREELPTIPKRERQEAFSKKTRGLLQQRQNARDKNNFKAYKTLNWRFRKSKKEDRTNMIMDTLDKDLDVRDKWLGI